MSFEGQTQKKWKAPLGAAPSVDGGALEKAEELLKQDELDLPELTNFFARGFANQAVQTWSYYAQVNDHSKFTAATSTLTKLLRESSQHEETLEQGIKVIKDLLVSYSKTLYRALGNMRPSTTNPVLRLMSEIVVFKNGALLDDFVALFDFTLPALPKLLIPTKSELADVAATKEKEHLSMRHNLLWVLLNIIKFSAPLLRKDFITDNTKILSNWFKYIATIDSEGFINTTLAVWEDKIVKESSFKKATKLKILNEWNIVKLLPLYYTSDKDLRSNLNKFILSIATDSKYGLRFAPDEQWFQLAGSNSSLEVNKKHFRTHNKVIYSILAGLKPWDDDMQLTTTVRILSGIPELIPPYTNYLASRGLHDPKLTSYWIGQTLLISKLISLDVPEEIEDYAGLNAPSKIIVGSMIVPPVLNRSVLTKCLQSDALLIRQLASQLIMDSVQKLKKFLKVYSSKNWQEARVDLINYVYHQLPDLSIVTNGISDSYTKAGDNKILLVTLLMVMNSYVTLFSDNHNYSQAISKPYMDVISKAQYSSIDLVLLDNFLQLQEGESSQLKWWNKSDKSNSLFTSLLKIASSNSASSMSSKVVDLLGNLLKQTVIFNYENLKIDPAKLLVYSLQLIVGDRGLDNADLSKIWTLLDESVSRSVRTPFKYLDISNEHQRLSPLVVTLFEQWKFVDKTTDYNLASKWFVLLLRSLIIAGEPSEPIWKLVSEIELDFDHSAYLFQSQLEQTINILSGDDDLAADTSFFGVVTTASLGRVKKDLGIPVSDMDVVGGFARIASAVQSEKTSLVQLRDVFADVLSKIGNYLYTHSEATKKFSSQKFWSPLYLTDSGPKSVYVSGVLIEIFSQLDDFDSADLSKKVKHLLTSTLTTDQEVVLGDSLWCLSNEDLRSVLSADSLVLKKSTLDLMLERKLTIHSTQVSSLLSIAALKSVLSQFVSKNLVVYGELKELFEAVVMDSDSLQILHSLVQKDKLLPELIDFVISLEDNNITTFTASALSSQKIHAFDDKEKLMKVLESAKSTSTSLIQAADFSFMSFEELSRVFTNDLCPPSDEQKEIVLKYALEKVSNKFAPEIPHLMKSVANFNDAAARTWLNKSVLYLTKVFAEYPEPPSQFFQFLANFKSLALKIDVSKVMNRANINVLLEVIFTKWARHETAMEFASIVSLSSTRTFLDYGKLLQILVNANDNVLMKSSNATAKTRYFTALLISRLYEFDPSKNSNAPLQEKLLTFYSGSTRPEDLLLFKTLEKLESKLNFSWIDNVYSWDFLDSLNENDEELIGETKLVEKKREGFVIVLNKKFITNGLRDYNVARPTLDITNAGSAENWKKAELFYKSATLTVSTEIADTAYDPLFLSLLVINNDELINVSSGEGTDLVVKANMKKLVETELLSSIIINLASEDKTVVGVTKKIIGALLSSLKEENATFKERRLFEIYLTKILYTYNRSEADYEDICPLIFIMVSRLATILDNPGHMLYERAFRWVLKNPYVNSNEIPLFQEITVVTTTSDENDLYYKQISWLIESLTLAVKTKADIQLLRNKNVFEWIMNLLNSPYVDARLRFQIYNFLSVSQNAEEGDILISRYAGLANIEQRLSAIADSSDTLQHRQEILNLKELAVKYSIIGQSKKRLVDWTSGDFERFTKRTLTY